MKAVLEYALPIAAALLLIAFFTGLPDLKRCLLPGEELPPDRERGKNRVRLSEALTVLLICAAYGAAAFTNLGNTDSPQSFAPMEGESALFELPEGAVPVKAVLFTGVSVGDYELRYSQDGEAGPLAVSFEQDYAAVLKWHELDLEPGPASRYVRLDCTSGSPWLGELALLEADGSLIPLTGTVPALCDEQETVPAKANYLNSAYFDEIYHVRTAWEHLNGIWPYEVSHPPLGKLIIALGITLFGMTPFGWRFMGTLFGVMMLPVLYLLLKKLFGGRAVPTLGTLLFASEFMHYTQTRIATIDTYAVFFILLMYLCMYIYLSRGSLRALALSGLFFGLGAASKWTCLYAGAGLAVLWALNWLGQFLALRPSRAPAAGPEEAEAGEEEEAGEEPAGEGEAAPAPLPGPDAGELFHQFVGNCLFCMIFFVFIPCLIYCLAYFPYGQARGVPLFSREYLAMVWENQKFMFSYHAGVVAEHPYSSRWYQWILNIRPILYYLEYFDGGDRSSICAFLNPAVCWGGLLSLFVLGYTALFRRDKKAAFILLGYLAQLVPWMFISRVTFEYHYFPSSVFLILAICYVFRIMRSNCAHWARYTVSFTAVSLLLFVLFFPALGGLRVDNQLASALMGWLPTWPI